MHATGELTQCSLSELTQCSLSALTQCSLSARVSFVECARARFSARYATLLPALRLIAPPSPTERAPGRSARRATQQAARADLLSSIQTNSCGASCASCGAFQRSLVAQAVGLYAFWLLCGEVPLLAPESGGG